jgi:hypothetical protein
LCHSLQRPVLYGAFFNCPLTIPSHFGKQYYPIVSFAFEFVLLSPEVYRLAPRSTGHDWRTRHLKSAMNE